MRVATPSPDFYYRDVDTGLNYIVEGVKRSLKFEQERVSLNHCERNASAKNSIVFGQFIHLRDPST